MYSKETMKQKTITVDVTFTFKGTVTVQNVQNKPQAIEMVKHGFFAMLNPTHITNPEIKDYDFNPHPVNTTYK